LWILFTAPLFIHSGQPDSLPCGSMGSARPWGHHWRRDGRKRGFVPEANVVARNTATNLTINTQTKANGSYQIPNLPIGNYEVTFSKSGFVTEQHRNVLVEGDRTSTVAGALKIGALYGREHGRSRSLHRLQSQLSFLRSGGDLMVQRAAAASTQALIVRSAIHGGLHLVA